LIISNVANIASAIANDMPLSTLNVKHFERIDDLELIEHLG